jgi:hypothetical protein
MPVCVYIIVGRVCTIPNEILGIRNEATVDLCVNCLVKNEKNYLLAVVTAHLWLFLAELKEAISRVIANIYLKWIQFVFNFQNGTPV